MLWKQVRAFGQLLKVSVSKGMQQNCKSDQSKIWALFATWYSAFPWAVQVQIKTFLRKGTAEPVLMISAPGIKVHKWPKLANNWILKLHNLYSSSMAGKWIRSNKYLPNPPANPPHGRDCWLQSWTCAHIFFVRKAATCWAFWIFWWDRFREYKDILSTVWSGPGKCGPKKVDSNYCNAQVRARL